MRRLVPWMMVASLLLPGAALAEGCTDPLSAAPRLTAEALDLDALHGFYHDPATCIWNDTDGATLQAVLAKLDEDGLDPDQFHAAALSQRAAPKDEPEAAERDLLLTDAALAYAQTMMGGRVDPAMLSDQIHFPRSPYDPADGLRTALGNGGLAAWLVQLAPPDPQYAALKQALVQYRALPDWQPVQAPADGKAIELGTHHPVIPAVKQRLVLEGVMAEADSDDQLAGPVVDALKRFQRRHGLNPDGRLGRFSFVALNISRNDRIGQIVANLERRREVARLLSPTRIEVNVAAASLAVWHDGQVVSTMRTVVGDPEHQTPMLISSIRDIEVNPPWLVPSSIQRKELMPKIRRDPDYLTKNAMYFEHGQLIQSPGDKNSLGHLKFEFPNPFSVYLHDTPSRHLFAREVRDLSHGCVRLEHPLELAQTLLAVEKPDTIQEKIASGETSHMRLPVAMPVAVLYWSAFVEEDGTADFREDFYQRDARLVAALRAPRPPVVGTATSCTGACQNI
jgi:murein L,D-transpeptidase YcbB/YkuD